MEKNLVLTAAFGFGISQLELFIKSLRKYYTGEVCFVIGLNDNNIEKELKKFDCEIIKKNIDKRDIQLKRYEIFLNFLNSKNYDKILFCDSRDIYFQSNPFDFKYQGQINFFQEDKKIKDCPYNSDWLIRTYGKETYNALSDKIISCGGTILGTHEAIKTFLSLMIEELAKHKFKKRLKYILTFRRDKSGRGSDQSHGNYIAHNNLIKNSFFYSNESGPIATVYYLKKIKFNVNNKLININNDPYLIVHQYDKRWNEFSSVVKKLMKDLNIN